MRREKAAEVVGEPVAPALLDQLLRRTGGDLDLLAQIRDQVDLTSDGLDRLPIQWPAERVEPLLARIAGLSRPGRAVLDAASVIGREFDLSVLERMDETIDVPAGLDEALAAGLVKLLPKQVCGFTEALMREVCYDGLGMRQRAELHERAASALAALGATGGSRAATLAELAHHTAEAAALGGTDRLDRAVAASAAAGGLSDEYPLRAEYFSQAALLAGRAGWAPGPAGRLLVAAGAARLHAGARQAGRASLLGALRLGRSAADPGLIAAAALAFGPPATLGCLAPAGRPRAVDEDRRDALTETWQSSELDPSTRARAGARLAAETGDGDLAGLAYAEARASGDPRAVAEALLTSVQIGVARHRVVGAAGTHHGPEPTAPQRALEQAAREAEALSDSELLARTSDLSAAVAVRSGARDIALRELAKLAALDGAGETAFVRWYAARAQAEAAALNRQAGWARLADVALEAGLAVDPAAAQESDRILRAADVSETAGPLTRREREVMDHALQGASAREIAEALVLAERTVETHLASIYRKLDVRSRVELIKRYGSPASPR